MEKEKIIDIIKELNKATAAYNAGRPYMSDEQWDELYFQVKQFEKETGIIYPNSPTQQVEPYPVVSNLDKVEHNHLMLSLAKTKVLTEIDEFCENQDVVMMAKLDGLTCSLTYKNGELVGAETRGDGQIGENVLHNVKYIKNVPQTIKTTKPIIVVDGEVICKYNDFDLYKNEYRNPRNFASGSIRLLDAKESATRNLSFVAWDGIIGFDEPTLHQKLNTLAQYGFEVVPWETDYSRNMIGDLQTYCEEHYYPIDGIVFKIDNCKAYADLGHTDHHFRGGIAYKFYDDLYNTKLLDIEWSMGKTGILTPVAIFEPITIDGTVISRASIHNVSLLRDIFEAPFVNQPIRIYKANQIIPQVYDTLVQYNYVQLQREGLQPIIFPKTCPYCGQPLSYRFEGVSEYCFCDNPHCSGKLINRLEHFFGKKGLDIKGLSESTFEKLIEWKWVNALIDVFNLALYRYDWVEKPGFGEKSVENILTAIDQGRSCELYQFISALGIPLIGVKYAKIIAEHMDTWDQFRNAINSGFNFMSWDGFGPELYTSIMNFNYDEADLIAKILDLKNSLCIKEENTTKELAGKTFVITGKLQKFKNRDALIEKIEAYGGKVVGSVSKNTTYLINNDITSMSTKNKTAKQLNIPIITEEDFENLLNASHS